MSIGSVLSELGDLGDNPRALEHYNRALEKYEAAGAGESPAAARCLKSIGTHHANKDDFRRAFEHYQRALAKYEAAGAGESPGAADCRKKLRHARQKAQKEV